MSCGRAFRAIAGIGMAAGLAAAGAAGAGCDDYQTWYIDLEEPPTIIAVPPPDDAGCDAGDDGGGDDAGDCTDSGEDGDAGTQEATCEGTCAPYKEKTGWTRPTVVWIGPAGATPPECPPNAPIDVLDGFANLPPLSHACPACTCEQTCSIPSAWSVLAATCDDWNHGPVESVAWDAPSHWDGACLAGAPPDPGSLCMGGACPLALEIAPPAHECAPVEQGAEEKEGPPWPWQTQARMCVADVDAYAGKCDEDSACSPALPEAAPASGRWATCIRSKGEHLCAQPYKEQVILFDDAEDKRACTPCTCTGPDGGACKVNARADTDATCGQALWSAELTSEKQTDYCFDLPADADLKGKWATLTDFVPGACTPGGGETTGGVVPFGATTLCCLPPGWAPE